METKRIPKIDDALNKLTDTFFKNEDAYKDKVIEAFKKLHSQMKAKYKDNKQIYDYFVYHSARAAGGIFIPYLLWEYVNAFVNNPDKEETEELREKIQELLHIFFGDSFFEEEEQKLMKPLIALYFRYEKPFEIDKFLEQKGKNYHRDVKKYIEKLRKFAFENTRTVAIYKRKLKYVNILNDYSKFPLPINELEEMVKNK